MKRFKKIVIVMMTACLLLGVKTNDSKQVEENGLENKNQLQLCENYGIECIELL